MAGVRILFYDALYGIDTGSRIMLVASNEWIRILVLEQFIKGPTEYTPYIVVSGHRFRQTKVHSRLSTTLQFPISVSCSSGNAASVPIGFFVQHGPEMIASDLLFAVKIRGLGEGGVFRSATGAFQLFGIFQLC